MKNLKIKTSKLANKEFYELTLSQIVEDMQSYLFEQGVKNDTKTNMCETIELMLHRQYPVNAARGGAYYGLFFSLPGIDLKFTPVFKKTTKLKKVSRTKSLVIYEFAGIKVLPYLEHLNMSRTLKSYMRKDVYDFIIQLIDNLYDEDATFKLALEYQFGITLDKFEDDKMLSDYIGTSNANYGKSYAIDGLIKCIYPEAYGYYKSTYVYKNRRHYKNAEYYGYFDKTVKDAKNIFTIAFKKQKRLVQ
jgi:hypothetical protein